MWKRNVFDLLSMGNSSACKRVEFRSFLRITEDHDDSASHLCEFLLWKMTRRSPPL
jgi:hypothetical protein